LKARHRVAILDVCFSKWPFSYEEDACCWSSIKEKKYNSKYSSASAALGAFYRKAAINRISIPVSTLLPLALTSFFPSRKMASQNDENSKFSPAKGQTIWRRSLRKIAWKALIVLNRNKGQVFSKWTIKAKCWKVESCSKALSMGTWKD
jgi:hypothetical protein